MIRNVALLALAASPAFAGVAQPAPHKEVEAWGTEWERPTEGHSWSTPCTTSTSSTSTSTPISTPTSTPTTTSTTVFSTSPCTTPVQPTTTHTPVKPGTTKTITIVTTTCPGKTWISMFSVSF